MRRGNSRVIPGYGYIRISVLPGYLTMTSGQVPFFSSPFGQGVSRVWLTGRVGIGVVVSVGMAVIVEVGSGEVPPGTTGWFVAIVVI
jgi:hypothetical protein